ncbi:MAG: hypothetical protein JWQ87_2046 [Candidatus Sulfotelmatobacter sp.]|nr:hypothetical protein [Candidatus Sulfotelmatobacter sp.]
MSIVTGIVVCMSLTDEHRNGPIITKWLEDCGYSELNPVDECGGGSKHPQMYIFVGGYNYFPNDKFLDFFKALTWAWPENAVLLLKPEEGPTAIYRPPY